MSDNTQANIPSWVMDWSLILAIVVLMVTFVNYGMSFLYPAPEYSDFCQQQRQLVAPDQITTETACLEEDGKWSEYESPREITQRSATSVSTTTVTGTCDVDYYCRQSFDAAQDIHDRNGLIAMLIIGLLISVFGFMRKSSDIISSSFSISGVIVILSGLIRFWTVPDDWAQFVLLGSLLVIFVFLAINRSSS